MFRKSIKMSNTKNVYCRLCAELRPLNELTNMQTDEETRQKVVNKLLRFNIEMNFQANICVGQNDVYFDSNTLPKTVCFQCVKSLEEAFTFITAVEQAQAFLNEFLIKTSKQNNCDDNTVLLPTEIDKDLFIEIKVENNSQCNDPMYVNDNDTNLGEDKDDEMNLSEDKDDDNVCNDDDVAVEEKINIKDETEIDHINQLEENEFFKFNNVYKDNHHNNVKENNLKDTKMLSAFNDKLMKGFKTEHNCEEISPSNNMDYVPPKNKSAVYSEDHINNQINRLREVPVEYLKMTWMDYEWKCSHCGTLFPNIEELQKHSMMYHSACNAYHCTDCKIKKQRLNAFIKHVRSHKKYLHYSCYKCFEKFPNIINTRQHKMKIHEKSKYLCLGCNTPFSSNAELEEHVSKYYNILWRRKTFVNADNLSCSTCNRTFAHITALRNHLNRHKPTKKDQICEKCGKGFDSKPKLKTHMDTHNERLLYHCEICKTSFKSVYSLRYHASIHSGIKPFACDVCNKSFRTKSQITNHMKFHSDYFPFPCMVCPKKFRTDKNLQSHMHQHTGAKPFSCDICPRDFTNLSNRNKHMRRRHGIEMAKRRQPIIKQLTADDPSSSGLAIEDIKLTDLDKINGWRNTTMDHCKTQKVNNKLKNVKVDA